MRSAIFGTAAAATAMARNARRMTTVCQVARVESKSAMAMMGSSSPQVP